MRYQETGQHEVGLNQGPFTAIVIDNCALDVPEVPDYRAGGNGVAMPFESHARTERAARSRRRDLAD